MYTNKWIEIPNSLKELWFDNWNYVLETYENRTLRNASINFFPLLPNFVFIENGYSTYYSFVRTLTIRGEVYWYSLLSHTSFLVKLSPYLQTYCTIGQTTAKTKWQWQSHQCCSPFFFVVRKLSLHTRTDLSTQKLLVCFKNTMIIWKFFYKYYNILFPHLGFSFNW